MVKYCGKYITFQEVPNEVSLTIPITNCPHRCPGCHSPWLQEDIGDELSQRELRYLLDCYPNGVTCVCFMGTGSATPAEMADLISTVHLSGYKVCVYDGNDEPTLLTFLQSCGNDNCMPDYYKIGSYRHELGGLSSPTTNQRMLKLWPSRQYEDITSWFWRKNE